MIGIENISKCGVATIFDRGKGVLGTEYKVNASSATGICSKVLSVLSMKHQINKPLFLAQGEQA